MATAVLAGDANFSLTERQVFSLYARYPEITFEQDDGIVHKESDQPDLDAVELDSSPVSTFAEGNTSRLSNSTAQTTPLRPLHLLQHRQEIGGASTIANYLQRIRQTDVPEECRLCFTSFAQSIGTISTGFVPATNGRYRINNTYFMDQCSVLLREVQIISDRTKEQINQVAHLKSLIIFKTTPTDDMLWAVYRQRALLIIRLAALPSISEYQLIQSLAHLYNTYVYEPAQLLHDDNELESAAIRMLNALYDALFTWVSVYRQWCNSMKELKQRYTNPLADRILATETVWSDVKSMQRAKRKAEIAVGNPVGPSMLPMDERVMNALNLSARRKEAVVIKRNKTRFRREKTI